MTILPSTIKEDLPCRTLADLRSTFYFREMTSPTNCQLLKESRNPRPIAKVAPGTSWAT